VQFTDLSPDGQVALAAWAVLTKSVPLEAGELTGFPCGFNRAVGDICKTVGLRSRKARNYDNIHRKRYKPRRKTKVAK
jgi:hypothetical protein